MKRKIEDEVNNKFIVCNKGITLISLVITIIILIILAGVAINLSLGQNGIFNRAKQAKENYAQSIAREKLETVLMEAVIEKETNENYNNKEFLNNMLEDKDMIVNGDSVIVDNYNFVIDREKLEVLQSEGETNIKVTAIVQKYLGKNENSKYEANILLTIESNTDLQSIIIKNPDGTELEINTDNGKIGKDITVEFDEEYEVIITTKDGKKETRKIVERTEETIRTEKELAEFRDKVNSGLTYEGKILNLTRNLDLRSVCNEEKPWMPIGGLNYEKEGTYNAFSGTFNGNKHSIDYLYIDTENTEELSQGLFGYTLGASITEIVIGDKSIIKSNNNIATGGIVGFAINSNISYCGNNANITGKNGVGGIVGVLDKGNIVACYNKGNIRCNYACAGGICGNAETWLYEGDNKDNIIQYSYNTGTIKLDTELSNAGSIGGICGYPAGYANIEKCYNRGEILGNNNGSSCYGGIGGNIKAKNYTNSETKHTIELKAKSQVNYTCNIGRVNSNGIRIGGICGENDKYCIVKNNYILQGLEVKKGSTQASREIGTSSSYLGKYAGQAYSTSTSYISGNGEITNEVNAENGDITDTVYYIVNGMNEGESEYWAKDDVTEPSLKWEIE